jgi:hypothetical protein
LPKMLGENAHPDPLRLHRLRRSYLGKVTKARPITPSGSEMASKFELKITGVISFPSRLSVWGLNKAWYYVVVPQEMFWNSKCIYAYYWILHGDSYGSLNHVMIMFHASDNIRFGGSRAPINTHPVGRWE